MPAVRARGLSVDREQLRHEMLATLAGPACDWITRGVSPATASRRARERARRHDRDLDYSDDLSLVFRQLEHADPFDAHAALREIPDTELKDTSPEELLARYGRPAALAHERFQTERLESLLREAVEFVASHWVAVVAVGQELFARKRLSGDEVTGIIEVAEARLADGPSFVASD